MDGHSAAIRQQLQMVIQTADLDSADRDARVQAGIAAYENARNDGLCHEGAWECALEAVHGLLTRARSS